MYIARFTNQRLTIKPLVIEIRKQITEHTYPCSVNQSPLPHFLGGGIRLFRLTLWKNSERKYEMYPQQKKFGWGTLIYWTWVSDHLPYFPAQLPPWWKPRQKRLMIIYRVSLKRCLLSLRSASTCFIAPLRDIGPGVFKVQPTHARFLFCFSFELLKVIGLKLEISKFWVRSEIKFWLSTTCQCRV